MKLKCGCPKEVEEYNEEFDAYYCPIHNIWLEDKCGDKDCDYCKNRPTSPSKTKSKEKKQ